VYFCDPKSSTVDIVQASGRAFRKDLSKPNKVGYVVVPILHKPGEDIDDVVSSSSFKNIVRVLQALGSADQRLVAQLCLSQGLRSGGGDGDGGGPVISLEGIEDQALSEKIFSDFIERSGNRLKPLLYADFNSAVEAILKACSDRPINVYNYFGSQGDYVGKGLKDHAGGIGFNALRNLAIDVGLATDKTTYIQLADLIWGKEDFSSKVEAIKKACANRPSSVSDYFRSKGDYVGEGLKEHAKIGFGALRNLAIDDGKASDETTHVQLADLIWGKEDFGSKVEAIKKACANRPSSVSDYFRSKGDYVGEGLKEHCWGDWVWSFKESCN
jgi:hypothetical protein